MLVFVSVLQTVHMTGGGYGGMGSLDSPRTLIKPRYGVRPYRYLHFIARQTASYPAASHGVWLVSILASPNSLRSP